MNEKTRNEKAVKVLLITVIVCGIAGILVYGAYRLGQNTVRKENEQYTVRNENEESSLEVDHALEKIDHESVVSEPQDSEMVESMDLSEIYALSEDYKVAMDAYNEKKYGEAAKLFQELGDYSDSETMYMECHYMVGKELLKNYDFDSAKAVFKALGDFKDSATMITECDYQKAVCTLEREDYAGAAEMFTNLGNYRDSVYQVSLCEFKTGCKLMMQGLYEEGFEHAMNAVRTEGFLAEFSKLYGGSELAKDETDYDSDGKEITISRRYRYWHDGAAAVIVDYIDDDENPDRYTFRPVKADGEGYGFIEFDPQGHMTDAWIFTD